MFGGLREGFWLSEQEKKEKEKKKKGNEQKPTLPKAVVVVEKDVDFLNKFSEKKGLPLYEVKEAKDLKEDEFAIKCNLHTPGELGLVTWDDIKEHMLKLDAAISTLRDQGGVLVNHG